MLAKLWEPLGEGKVRCDLCCHACVIVPGKRGLCGVRANVRGELHTLVGDNVVAVHLDPVEKKPLYHYRPGSMTYSLGTMGCNFACKFCQNASISRTPADKGQVGGTRTTPEILVDKAESLGAQSVAFTYNEPTVYFELMWETAGTAMARGLDCLMVSNGYQSKDCLAALYRRIRAANIDLKSFSEEFYRTRCKARLAPVLDNLKDMVKSGWWVEVTTLLIPRCNDSPEEVRDIARFIRQELGAHVPWHISRFHGAHQMQSWPATTAASLEKAWLTGKEEGLHYVYVGNIGLGLGSDTLCPSCGAVCVTRQGFSSRSLLKPGGACPKCGQAIEGIWE